jgi:DNA repair protein RadC
VRTHTIQEAPAALTLPKPRAPRRPRASVPGDLPELPKFGAKEASAPALLGLAAHEEAVIVAALAILGARLRQAGAAFDSPIKVKQFLVLNLTALEREVFGVMFLDARLRLIEFEVMFDGTLTQTSVYPREVVRRALQLNAASVILSHNHPSGVPDRSQADELLTATLKSALALVDVRTLDHVIVGGLDSFSFAEHGLM